MADIINKITLRIYVPTEADIVPVDSQKVEKGNLEMSTGSDQKSGHMMVKNDETLFNISIQDISYTKKMYSPNVMMTELHIKNANEGSNVLPSKKQLEDMFLKMKVEAICNDNYTICNDYYVQKIEPLYTATDVYVKLTIYSPDYQMTIDESCRTFVAKRLSEVLDEQKEKFVLPYKTDTAVAINHSQMQHVVKGGKEHIFPYLVQYNESYYDFLKRITNRWGEFLYYENGKLNVGYNNEAEPTLVEKYNSRTYCAIDATAAMANDKGLHSQATADANMLDNPMTKGEYDVVKAQINSLGNPDGGQDKYIMSKIASLFANNKSLGAWALNTVVDDLVAWGLAEIKKNQKNEKFDNNYFTKEAIDKAPAQFNSDQNKFNQFSEYNPILSVADYAHLLKMELTAGREAMKIDFLTTYPNLKLGEKIKVAGETYLVVELKGYQKDLSSMYYEATGVAIDTMTYKVKNKKNEDEEFSYTGYFPPFLESGHIRKSSVQHAKVVDDDDPLRSNRVRVKFEWQDDSDTASPWLLFAQNAATGGAGVHGRHYKDEEVLVDFVNGNIERPYVIGAVNQKIPTPLKTSSIAMMSPAAHGLRVSDGTGAGYTAFAASLTPGLKMIQGLCPGMDPLSCILDKDKSKYFEGSTEICDYYGIYSIKGSTDDRSVSIKSAWGDVKINAFTGITVSAPNGDVKIAGKNVTIEAGNNLKLVSGTNIKNKFISRASSDSGESFAAVMGDAALIVAKKLESLAMNVFDLSLLRTMFEVGWKPQEGLLEIQSNRFLKLEAGGAQAGYPMDNDSYKSKAILEKEYKSKVNNTFKMAPAIVKLISKIDPCVNDLIKNYKKLYRDCIDKRIEFEDAIGDMMNFSNTGKKYCNDYNDMKALLWNKNTKDIKETDLHFVDDEVGVNNNAVITTACRNRGRTYMFIETDNVTKQRRYVIKMRKEHRADIVKKANALLQSIQNLRKVHIKNYQQTWDVGYYFGTFTRFVPKDFIEAFKKAFDPERLKGTYYYNTLLTDGNAEFKELTEEIVNSLDNNGHKLALKRRVAVNLLTDWGIKDKAQGVQGELVIPETEDNLLNATWVNYVTNLSITEGQIIEKDTGLIGTIAGDFLQKIDFVRPIREYYSWGKAKNGKILFSDNNTYQLGDRITAVETKFGGGKFTRAQLGDEADQKINGFMRPIRQALNAIGAVAQQPAAGVVQGNVNGEVFNLEEDD
jgi:hypothetical protein